MIHRDTLVTSSLPAIEDVSRRGLLSIVLTTAAFVACGSDEKVDEETPAASARFPRTVSHSRGVTTISAEPQRIVAMTGFAELDSLLALGLKPIAARRRFTEFLPWVQEAGVDGVQGIPENLQPAQIDMELVASLRPDLLLGSDALITEESYGRFSAIAPTVATSAADWRQTLAVTADAVGRTDEGSRVAAEADRQVQAAAEEIAKAGLAGRTVVFLIALPNDQLFTVGAGHGAGQTAKGLDLALPRDLDDPSVIVKPFSKEQLASVLSADYVVGLVRDDTALAASVDLEADLLFRSLPVVQSRRYARFTVDQAYSIFFPSIMTVPRSAAILRDAILALPRP